MRYLRPLGSLHTALRPALWASPTSKCLRARSASHRFLAFASHEENPVVLRAKGCSVHLLGTMHIAEASATATRELISREHAQGSLAVVFLELDEERRSRLEEAKAGDEPLLSHLLSVARRGRTPGAAAVELGLTVLYRALYRVGFASGVEFRAALELTRDLHPSPPIVLGDQHIRITLARLASAVTADLSLPRIMSFLTSPPPTTGRVDRALADAVRAMATGDAAEAQRRLEVLLDRDTARELVGPLRTFAPTVTNAILDERDTVMAARLYEEALKYPGKSIVAVVGLAHVDGIVQKWNVLAG